MKISDKGIELIKHFEGCELHAYKDIVGVVTIGYGHTGSDVAEGQTVTEEEAEATKECSALSLVNDHGLNENQVRLVMLWCQHECQRMWGQGSFTAKSEEELEACHSSPYKLHKHLGFRS